MADPFVSLHNHSSSGSLLDALIRYEELIDRAKMLGQTAVALTDHGAVFSNSDAYKYSKKVGGIKFLAGNEFYFRHDHSDPDERGNKHLVLIARNATGYKNILKLNYLAWQKPKTIFMKQYPIISWEELTPANTEGIICLTACSSGVLSRHIMNNALGVEGSLEKLHCDVVRLKNIFGENFFLETQPHALITDNGKVNQLLVNDTMFKLSKEYGIKVVASCDAHYLDPKDADYHDMLLAIKDKKPRSADDRHRYGSKEQPMREFYLKGGKAIHEFFEKYHQNQGAELITNTNYIASICDEASYLSDEKIRLPEFPVSDAHDYNEFKSWRSENLKTEMPDDQAYLRYKTYMGWQKLYDKLEPEQVDEYYQRLKLETSVITSKGFSSYMLMVTDFIEEAKRQGDNPSGYGRGSVAGSLIAYLTGITKVDPIKHKLLFERFLNKYKKSFPDIDMEFFNQHKIIEYAKKKYGEKRVAQISNVMVMTPKVAVKDVARSLELGSSPDNTEEERKTISFRIANDITKSMPDVGTIEEAIKSSDEFAGFMRKYPELLSNCLRLQNVERQMGVHAAGIVVTNEDLDGIAPLRCDKDGSLVLGYDKDKAEEAGFIKFDFLGLNTLGVLAEAINIVHSRTGLLLDLDTIPTDDQKVYSMIGKGDVKCVFQLGLTSASMCKAIKPKSIDEIAIVTAIIRPSVPIEQRKAYVNRRNGEKVKLIHPTVAEATKNTFGEVLYEEQLMTLARDVVGWDLSRADSLRKITKLKEKGKELTEKTRKEFVEDAFKVNAIDDKTSNEIWEYYVENFTGYGFNCSHATAYSYISYFTAWFKYYYPTEFMCAMLNSKDPNSDKTQEYKQETLEMGIKILPPDINLSALRYEVVDNNTIRTNLYAIKGIGEGAIEYLLAHRPYKSFADFIMKSTGTKDNRSPVSKTIIESLAKAGCFDVLGITRKNVLEKWQDIKTKVSSATKKATKNNTEVDFSNIMDDIDQEDEYPKKQILKNEMEVIGHYLTGTHNDIYGGFFKKTPDITALENIGKAIPGQTVKIEGIIKIKIKEFKIKNAKSKSFGKSFAKYLIEDIYGKTAELTLWPDHYEKMRAFFNDGTPIRALCEVNEYNDSKSLVLRQVEDIPDVFVKGKLIKK